VPGIKRMNRKSGLLTLAQEWPRRSYFSSASALTEGEIFIILTTAGAPVSLMEQAEWGQI